MNWKPQSYTRKKSFMHNYTFTYFFVCETKGWKWMDWTQNFLICTVMLYFTCIWNLYTIFFHSVRGRTSAQTLKSETCFLDLFFTVQWPQDFIGCIKGWKGYNMSLMISQLKRDSGFLLPNHKPSPPPPPSPPPARMCFILLPSSSLQRPTIKSIFGPN